MRRFLLLIVVICVCILPAVESQAHGESMRLIVTTVDVNGNLMPAEAVRWWRKGQRRARRELRCDNANCTKWILDEPVSGKFVVNAVSSIVKKEDAYCWDLYEGQRVVEMSAKEIEVVLVYTSTVCS
jgi:hypothetical protein